MAAGSALQQKGLNDELQNNSANRKAALAGLIHQYAGPGDYTNVDKALNAGVNPDLVMQFVKDSHQKDLQAQWEKDWDASGHVMNPDLAIRAVKAGLMDMSEAGKLLGGNSEGDGAVSILQGLINKQTDPQLKQALIDQIPSARSQGYKIFGPLKTSGLLGGGGDAPKGTFEQYVHDVMGMTPDQFRAMPAPARNQAYERFVTARPLAPTILPGGTGPGPTPGSTVPGFTSIPRTPGGIGPPTFHAYPTGVNPAKPQQQKPPGPEDAINFLKNANALALQDWQKLPPSMGSMIPGSQAAFVRKRVTQLALSAGRDPLTGQPLKAGTVVGRSKDGKPIIWMP